MIIDILPEILAECNIDRAAPVISDGSFEMRQITALLNAAGREINTRNEWARGAVSFTAASVASVALPADFQELAETGPVMVGTGYNPARLVTSPELWQLLSRTPSAQNYFRLEGGNILFAPAIGAGGVTIRYQSKNWLGTKDAVTANTDTAIFPERLLARAVIYRWKRSKGLPYEDLMAEFEADLETAANADKGLA